MSFYFCYLLAIIVLCSPIRIKTTVSVRNKIDKRRGFIYAIFLIIFVSSIRMGIGYDWYNYEEIIRWYGIHGLNLSRYEFFDNFIFFIGGMLGNPIISFSIFAVVTYGILGCFVYKYSENRFESLIIYLALFYFPSLSTIRQAAAVVIILLGYKYIREKKLLMYIFTVVIAMGFHVYAFVGVLLYPLYYMSIPMLIVLGSVFVFSCEWLLPIFVTKWSPENTYYLSDLANSSGNFQRIIYLLFWLYCFFLVVMVNKKNIRNEGYYDEIYSLLKICSIGVVLPFVLGGHTGGRVAEYFLIYYILLIPLCNRFLKWRFRFLMLLICGGCFFAYLYVTLNSGNAYIPFKACWMGR